MTGHKRGKIGERHPCPLNLHGPAHGSGVYDHPRSMTSHAVVCLQRKLGVDVKAMGAEILRLLASSRPLGGNDKHCLHLYTSVTAASLCLAQQHISTRELAEAQTQKETGDRPSDTTSLSA